MNSIEVWHMLNTIFLIFGALLLIATIFEFFAFNIKKIFQDLTGITQKREIKAMSEDTEYTGQLKHKTSFKKNEKIVSPSGKLNYAKNNDTTGKLNKSHRKAVITPPPATDNNAIYVPKEKDFKNEETVAALHSQQANRRIEESETETGVLRNSERETEMLQSSERETEILQSSERETQILHSFESETETSVLRKEGGVKKDGTEQHSILNDSQSAAKHREIHFLLERQILMTHTNEIIE